LRLVAAPGWVNNIVLPAVPTMLTRKKSADEELVPCARYQDSERVSVPVAGSVMAGDRTLVVPPRLGWIYGLDGSRVYVGDVPLV
jgi:hypothetical protein